MWAVDTNVLVRLITQDEPKQTAAARTLMTKGAWASLLVVGETLWVVANVYELDNAAQIAAVESLLDQRNLVIQDADVVAAALARFRARPRLGFYDCLILEAARKAGHLPLGTFDRPLSKETGAELVG